MQHLRLTKHFPTWPLTSSSPHTPKGQKFEPSATKEERKAPELPRSQPYTRTKIKIRPIPRGPPQAQGHFLPSRADFFLWLHCQYLKVEHFFLLFPEHLHTHTRLHEHMHAHSKYLGLSCLLRAKSELPGCLQRDCGLPHSPQEDKCLDSDCGTPEPPDSQEQGETTLCPVPPLLGHAGGNLLQTRPLVPITWLFSSPLRNTWHRMSSSGPRPVPDPELLIPIDNVGD